MKPTAWLLNFGRGHLIDDAALIAAAGSKKIGGAILDVFRQEPLPETHPFWKATASSCCRTSAAVTQSATPSWPSCSLITWVDSWMETVT